MSLKRKRSQQEQEKVEDQILWAFNNRPVAELWPIWQPFYNHDNSEPYRSHKSLVIDDLFGYALDMDKTGASCRLLLLLLLDEKDVPSYCRHIVAVLKYKPNRFVTPENFYLTMALFGCRQFAVKRDDIGLYRGIVERITVVSLLDLQFAQLLSQCSAHIDLISMIHRDGSIYTKTALGRSFTKEPAYHFIDRKQSLLPLPRPADKALFATCTEHDVQIMESPLDCWRRHYDAGEKLVCFGFVWHVQFMNLTRLALHQYDLRNRWLSELGQLKQLQALHLSSCTNMFDESISFCFKELTLDSHQYCVVPILAHQAPFLETLITNEASQELLTLLGAVTCLRFQQPTVIVPVYFAKIITTAPMLLELDFHTRSGWENVFPLQDVKSKDFRTLTINDQPIFRDQKHAHMARAILKRKFSESNAGNIFANSIRPLIPHILYAAFNTTSPTLRQPFFVPRTPH